jgi:hypothetical protein
MTLATRSPICLLPVSPLLGLGRLTVRTRVPFIPCLFRTTFSFLGQIDVTAIPKEGSWLQLIKDGTTQFNTGANGIQRLDKVVELAKKHNIYVYFTLTNNWNPSVTDSPPPATTPSPLPRNFLSNDYGQYPVLVESRPFFPDWIILRWNGRLRSRIWCAQEA